MNRIILIGNGFDLAHGLKTSYADFINWYWEEWGKRLMESKKKIEEDAFCSFELRGKFDINNWYLVRGYYFQNINMNAKEFIHRVKMDTSLCILKYKSPFFEQINKQIESKKWVDIENEYYAYICHDWITHDDVKKANDDMDFIKSKLIEYLKFVQEDALGSFIMNNNLKNKFIEHFDPRDISLEGLSKLGVTVLNGKAINYVTETSDARLMCLNFNYTNLADKYFHGGSVIVHIHGELSNPSSVIFGYGDELDDDYRLLLKKNDNEYLRNIKSIRYMESSCYRAVLEFIESAPFQIYIMGHSCGNSDRTLLNTLFEHKNCVSIKPYYYVNENGEDNYIELIQNIYRNFTDMKLARDRVVNKELCETLL